MRFVCSFLKENTLFESLSEKLDKLSGAEPDAVFPAFHRIRRLSIIIMSRLSIWRTMFGLVKNQRRRAGRGEPDFRDVACIIYICRAADMQKKDIYAVSLLEKNQFIVGGHLNMRLVLEKFVLHFHDLYGDSNEKFVEEEGRKYFLLYLRPIINGTGNYYIESQNQGAETYGFDCGLSG